MRFPSIRDVAAELACLKRQIEPEFCDEEGNDGMDVRLQVSPDGGWYVHSGDPCYDTDHRGWWGAGFLAPDSSCRALAVDLIDQARDHAAQCQEDQS